MVARGDGSYPRLLSQLAKIDLLVLDDWGLAPFTDVNGRDLLEVIDDRPFSHDFILTIVFYLEYDISKDRAKYFKGGFGMLISATEFKTNIGKYLKLAAKEEIIITKNGKRIAKLSGASEDKTDIVKSLIGILPNSISEIEAREERMAKHERNN